MSNLIKIALNRICTEESKGFDLSKSTASLIKESTSYPFTGQQFDEVLPIEAQKQSWDILVDEGYNYMQKSYTLPTLQHMLYFLNELLQKSNTMHHHPLIQINNKQIDIKLYTHDVNDVTQQDIILSKYIDELYEDVTFITRM